MAFLADWFAAKPEISRLGHAYEASQLSDDDLFQRHKEHRGMSRRKDYLEKKRYVRGRRYQRPAQRFADFSEAACDQMDNPHLAQRTFGGVAELHGEDPVEYLSFIGLRGDEPQRVVRIQQRNMLDPDSKERRNTDHPAGEFIYPLLADLELSKSDVLNFWSAQDWDLRIPHDVDASNCVYCFMKGGNRLRGNVARLEALDRSLPKKLRSQPGTPSDIGWWTRIEETYTRTACRRGKGNGKEIKIGFFGADAPWTYRRLAEQALPDVPCMAGELPCDCTD